MTGVLNLLLGSAGALAPSTIEVLIVGGGGGGGAGIYGIITGSGGGAGGVVYNASKPVSAGTPYTITVGASVSGSTSGNKE